jgi:hypothetical protein
MSFPLWYASVFELGAGGLILAFWVTAAAAGWLPKLLEGRTDGPAHVAAEFVAGGLLIAGGAATIARHTALTSVLLFGLGAGALLYVLVEAPMHYRRRVPLVAFALLATWPAAILAIVARFAS